MKLKDVLFLAGILLILVCTLWTGYQVSVLVRGDIPSFAQAGSYYWEVQDGH